MLALAQDYAEELIKKERETWEDKKYWYYNCSSYMHPIEVDANTWERTQLVSLNDSGEVIGYLGYSIEREVRYVKGVWIVNFTDDKAFGIDVMQMFKDIFEKYHYRTIVFSVIIGNPIEPKYDRLIEHYGGRIVGINKEHVMLPDGELYDMKFYEIFRTDYLEHRKNVKSAG